MASQNKDFSHESLQDRESIIKYFKALGEGFQKGQLTLASNGEQFALEPPSLMTFDVRAKQKSDESQIVLKITWKRTKEKELRVEPLTIEGQSAEGSEDKSNDK